MALLCLPLILMLQKHEPDICDDVLYSIINMYYINNFIYYIVTLFGPISVTKLTEVWSGSGVLPFHLWSDQRGLTKILQLLQGRHYSFRFSNFSFLKLIGLMAPTWSLITYVNDDFIYFVFKGVIRSRTNQGSIF